MITNLYEKGDEKSKNKAIQMEQGFIDILQKKKPILFIDTSENGLSTFHYRVTPLVNEYLKKNYYFLNEINKMKIYKIKKK